MSTTQPIIVSVEEFARALVHEPDALLLDVRYLLGGGGGQVTGTNRSRYRAGHIPGAVFVDLETELAGPPGRDGRHPLPTPEAMGQLFTRIGLVPGRQVLIYDGGQGVGAARAWWCLRYFGAPDGSIRVLAGGFEAWVDAGRAVEAGNVDPVPAPEPVVVAGGGMPAVDPSADGYLDALAAGEVPYALVDARAAERFRGEVEPIDPVAGHIPGAGNLPYTSLVRDGKPLDPDLIRTLVDLASVQSAAAPGAPVALYCGSGLTAAVGVMVLAEAGISAAMYPGSWSAWITGDRPIATG